MLAQHRWLSGRYNARKMGEPIGCITLAERLIQTHEFRFASLSAKVANRESVANSGRSIFSHSAGQNFVTH